MQCTDSIHPLSKFQNTFPQNFKKIKIVWKMLVCCDTVQLPNSLLLTTEITEKAQPMWRNQYDISNMNSIYLVKYGR